MAFKQADTTRRRLLKGIGATGLALGGAGVATASGDDDQVSPEGSWEYTCLSSSCSSGDGCQQQRRYCSDGDCSGWEDYGCCGSGDLCPE